MTRFMTCWMIDTGEILAFTEDEGWQKAQEESDEFVWQWAVNRETAIAAHIHKVEEWENNPTKETY